MKKSLIIFVAILLVCALAKLFFVPNDDGSKDIASVVVICISSGIIVAIATAMRIERSYKRKLHSEQYPFDKYTSKTITSNVDILLDKYVTSTPILSSNRRK